MYTKQEIIRFISYLREKDNITSDHFEVKGILREKAAIGATLAIINSRDSDDVSHFSCPEKLVGDLSCKKCITYSSQSANLSRQAVM